MDKITKISDTSFSIEKTVTQEFDLKKYSQQRDALQRDIDKKQDEIAQLQAQIAGMNTVIDDAKADGVLETGTSPTRG
jgi:hypothetical protein